MESSVFPLLTDPWSAWNENWQRSQKQGCQAHRRQYAQIIKFFIFHGKDGSNIHKAIISRVHFHPVQMMIQLSVDCKWNVQSRYWKPRIVESHHTHKQAHAEQSFFQKKLHGQAHFNGFINSSILHKHSAQAPNQTHHLKTFSTSTKEMQETNRLKEKIS